MSNWKILVVMGVALFATRSALAEEQIHAISHGTYELPLLFVDGVFNPNPQVGELITCPGATSQPFQHLLRITMVYDRFEGVCDDLGTSPCNGRLTGIREACLGMGDDNVGESGRIDASYGNGGKLRVCWDESATGHCSAEYEVASGEPLGGQTRLLQGSLSGHSIGVVSISKGDDFVVDGEKVKVAEVTAIAHGVYEANDFTAPIGNQCVLPEPIRQRSACGSTFTETRSK